MSTNGVVQVPEQWKLRIGGKKKKKEGSRQQSDRRVFEARQTDPAQVIRFNQEIKRGDDGGEDGLSKPGGHLVINGK